MVHIEVSSSYNFVSISLGFSEKSKIEALQSASKLLLRESIRLMNDERSQIQKKKEWYE